MGKRSSSFRRQFSAVLALGVCCIALPVSLSGATPPTPAPAPTPTEPPAGWATTLAGFLAPTAAVPTTEPITDGQFHEWSWEAFAWATALDSNGLPRFMSLNTPADLLGASGAAKKKPHLLQLALRSPVKHGTAGYTEGAGAIVEADGNMLVALNGYPVYASVHFNASYLQTAQQNLVITGAFDANAQKDDYFSVGAAVFKATWLGLNPATQSWAAGTYSTQPPTGAFVTQAQVPVLTSEVIDGFTIIHPVIPSQVVTINVALVGLHVVGYANNHPEFLWGTFEHNQNAPMLADNTFTTSLTPDPNNHTFYQGKTPYTQVNLANQNPGTVPVLNATTQTLSPVTNVVQENATGGENFSPAGPANITALNTASQAVLAGQTNPTQALFANYRLIGTVWLAPNSYSITSTAANAVGSVNLANSTAETFQQVASNANPSKVQNCFTCHNATSYSFQAIPHAVRRVAISHVLAQGIPYYGVPNQIPATPLISGLK
jgi:hypothetical protein